MTMSETTTYTKRCATLLCKELIAFTHLISLSHHNSEMVDIRLKKEKNFHAILSIHMPTTSTHKTSFKFITPLIIKLKK